MFAQAGSQAATKPVAINSSEQRRLLSHFATEIKGGRSLVPPNPNLRRSGSHRLPHATLSLSVPAESASKTYLSLPPDLKIQDSWSCVSNHLAVRDHAVTYAPKRTTAIIGCSSPTSLPMHLQTGSWPLVSHYQRPPTRPDNPPPPLHIYALRSKPPSIDQTPELTPPRTGSGLICTSRSQPKQHRQIKAMTAEPLT